MEKEEAKAIIEAILFAAGRVVTEQELMIALEISQEKIENIINQASKNTNDKTIANYINYLCDAFAFYKIRRYDIQGKRYLSSVDKYYKERV